MSVSQKLPDFPIPQYIETAAENFNRHQGLTLWYSSARIAFKLLLLVFLGSTIALLPNAFLRPWWLNSVFPWITISFVASFAVEFLAYERLVPICEPYVGYQRWLLLAELHEELVRYAALRRQWELQKNEYDPLRSLSGAVIFLRRALELAQNTAQFGPQRIAGLSELEREIAHARECLDSAEMIFQRSITVSGAVEQVLS